MSPNRLTARLGFGSLVLLVARLAVHARCLGGRYERLRLGACRFYGPASFLNVCSTALEELRTLDQALFDSLLGKKFVIWYEPKGPVSFRRHFGISEPYLEWREKGVIACLVHTYFLHKLWYEPDGVPHGREELAGISSEIYSQVRCWLENRSFPNGLVSCFSNPPLDGQA
jgi:hypothetical protein